MFRKPYTLRINLTQKTPTWENQRGLVLNKYVLGSRVPPAKDGNPRPLK